MCWNCHSWGPAGWWGSNYGGGSLSQIAVTHNAESDQRWSSCSYLLQAGIPGIILEASIT